MSMIPDADFLEITLDGIDGLAEILERESDAIDKAIKRNAIKSAIAKTKEFAATAETLKSNTDTLQDMAGYNEQWRNTIGALVTQLSNKVDRLVEDARENARHMQEDLDQDFDGDNPLDREEGRDAFEGYEGLLTATDKGRIDRFSRDLRGKIKYLEK